MYVSKRIQGLLLFALLIFAGSLITVKTSKAVNGNLTGSCGMIVNMSHWGVPVNWGNEDTSTNTFLMLVNFDTGQITGYGSKVTFGSADALAPTTYTTGSGGIAFTQSPDAVTGFVELTPANLNQMPKLKVLPVNGGNTFLITTAGAARDGAGGSGMCQKV